MASVSITISDGLSAKITEQRMGQFEADVAQIVAADTPE